MALYNPLTKFPLSVTPPGSASGNSPNRPQTYKTPVVKYTPVGTVTHAPHMQLTPLSNKIQFTTSQQAAFQKLAPKFGQ